MTLDFLNNKEELINFINKNIGKFDYERALNFDKLYNEDNYPKTYEEFEEYNKKCVQELNFQDLQFLAILINKINKGTILQVDEENPSCMWNTYTVFFDKNKNLVLMHPR